MTSVKYFHSFSQKVYEHIKLAEKYHFHFALFIIIQDEPSGSIKGKYIFIAFYCSIYFSFFNMFLFVSVLRKLQEFESPFITYKCMSSTGSRIVLRKNYWDTTYDVELLNDPVTLNLLYIQAAAEIRSGWILLTKEVQHQLENLEKSGNRKEVRLLRQTNDIFE